MIASVFYRNRFLGKTFWFTVYDMMWGMGEKIIFDDDIGNK